MSRLPDGVQSQLARVTSQSGQGGCKRRWKKAQDRQEVSSNSEGTRLLCFLGTDKQSANSGLFRLLQPFSLPSCKPDHLIIPILSSVILGDRSRSQAGSSAFRRGTGRIGRIHTADFSISRPPPSFRRMSAQVISNDGTDADLPSVSITMLGAGQEVGRSCCVIKHRGKTVVCDVGLHPANNGLSALPFIDELDWSTVDAILVTQ